MARYWTEKEIQILRDNFKKKTYKELAKLINHSADSIAYKARSLGLQKVRRWQPHELAILREHIGSKTHAELARLTGHPVSSVASKAQELGLYRRKPVPARPWSPDEEDFLRKHWRSLTARELAKRLGRSYHSVRNKLHKLGLAVPRSKISASKSLDLSIREICYLAGLFDGDGSIILNVTDKGWRGWEFTHSISFTNTHLATVDFVAEKLGFRSRRVRQRLKRGKPVGEAVTGKRAQIRLVLKTLLPYLRIKRALALKMLEFLDALDAQPRLKRDYKQLLQICLEFQLLKDARDGRSKAKIERLRALLRSYNSKTASSSVPKR